MVWCGASEVASGEPISQLRHVRGGFSVGASTSRMEAMVSQSRVGRGGAATRTINPPHNASGTVVILWRLRSRKGQERGRRGQEKVKAEGAQEAFRLERFFLVVYCFFKPTIR